ncbi:MAG TPA: hypothetical protein IGR15_05810 [Synechococcus sp. M44_DOE_062]|nr:hypothetical protein [Synechococcus sp. M44_DOE_062]
MTIRSIVEEAFRTRCFTSRHETLIYRLLRERRFDEADLEALARLTEAIIQGIVRN